MKASETKLKMQRSFPGSHLLRRSLFFVLLLGLGCVAGVRMVCASVMSVNTGACAGGAVSQSGYACTHPDGSITIESSDKSDSTAGIECTSGAGNWPCGWQCNPGDLDLADHACGGDPDPCANKCMKLTCVLTAQLNDTWVDGSNHIYNRYNMVFIPMDPAVDCPAPADPACNVAFCDPAKGCDIKPKTDCEANGLPAGDCDGAGKIKNLTDSMCASAKLVTACGPESECVRPKDIAVSCIPGTTTVTCKECADGLLTTGDCCPSTLLLAGADPQTCTNGCYQNFTCPKYSCSDPSWTLANAEQKSSACCSCTSTKCKDSKVLKACGSGTDDTCVMETGAACSIGGTPDGDISVMGVSGVCEVDCAAGVCNGENVCVTSTSSSSS